MNATKNQLKRLRYICGSLAYNQPCTRKYTGEGGKKVRQIGKFKYIELGNELVYFEYDGDIAALSNYDAEEFLSALADDSGFHLGGGIRVEGLPSADTNGHNDVVDATAAAIRHITEEVPPQNEGHEVAMPIEAPPASDGWMDADGNDPEGLDHGTADLPALMDPSEKTDIKAAEPASPRKGGDGASFDTPEGEDALREVAMTAAAREAARLCGVISGNAGDTSVDIIRHNATVPSFLNVYGECLKRTGNPRSLDEIAAALPAQRNWIFEEGTAISPKENI